MNKKEVNKIITVGLTTSIVLSPISDTLGVVNAYANSNNYTNELNDVKELEQVYLSDIPYLKGSKPGWGSIMIDKNIDGNTINLIVDGDTTEFTKGVGAHAPSTLIYDISDYSSDYTRFVSYMGVDRSQNGRGSVSFTISISYDGEVWEEVKQTAIVTSSNEAIYIDVDLKGANYIKLYADANGSNGNDHAIYADAKLVKDDYSLSDYPLEGLNTVEYYDNILNNSSIENNLEDNEFLILKREFVNKLGYESLQRMSSKSEGYSEGISYLLTNKDALKHFIGSGPINIGGSYHKSLQFFCDIYSKYSSDLKDPTDDYFNLRLAISISLAFSRRELVCSWVSSEQPLNAIKRYEAYQELVTSKRMDEGGNQDGYGNWSTKQFKELPIALMRWSVDARVNNDEILWLADYVLEEKKLGKDYLSAYNYITYTFGYNYANPEFYKEENRDKYNSKYNFDAYYDNYGDTTNQRLWMVYEEGAVCGGLTQTYSNISDVLGRPSSPCGQPGHAAAITWGWNKNTNRYEWMLQNDVFSWTKTGNQFDDRLLNWGINKSWSEWYNASYTVLATDAIYEGDAFYKATLLNLLANSYTDNSMKIKTYIKALEYQKLNLDSLEGLLSCYKVEGTLSNDDYFDIAKFIIDTFTYYPQVMMEIITLAEEGITDSSMLAQLDLLKHNALVKASNCTPDVSTNVTVTKQLANKYLGTDTLELASFSFDGENANKLIINSKYTGSQIRVRYSFDGGVTWKESEEHTIDLTEDDLKNINSTNDIQVGLVGTDEVYVIDILEGKTISSSVIYANDNENKFIGDIANLEFSLDGGITWCNYVSDNTDIGDLNVSEDGCIVFEGNKTVKVRYKANGVYLNSNTVDYVFTDNNKDNTRKYVPLKNISLVDCSTENSANHVGTHLLDGTPNTGYHTVFGTKTEDKFFTVEFDKVRYINSIEYQSNGNNGKLRNGEIYTSLDGVNWVLSASFSELGRNNTLKTINLDKPTACKYLKIVAINTYGNYDSERDMYFSGNMLSFYEDATKEYIANPIINYSTTSLTNNDVVATLSLPDGCKVIGENTYTFKENGVYTFNYVDANGVEQSIDATVSWIDKESPIVNVLYSEKNLTNKDVTVTITGLKENEYVENNNGELVYTFKENGSFEFIVKDSVGNITKVPISVDWIDKEVPTATIEYDNRGWTASDVVAKLTNLSEDVTILGGGLDTYTFKENGVYTFEFVDKAGNIGVAEACVTWIDKTKPNDLYLVDFDKNKNEITSTVQATLNVDLDAIEILNNGGKATYIFTENETFIFKLRIRSTGFEFEFPITVDWIVDEDIKDEDIKDDITNDNINGGGLGNGTNNGTNDDIIDNDNNTNNNTDKEDSKEDDIVDDTVDSNDNINNDNNINDDIQNEDTDNNSNKDDLTNDNIVDDNVSNDSNENINNSGSNNLDTNINNNDTTIKPSDNNITNGNSSSNTTNGNNIKPNNSSSNTTIVKPNNTTNSSNSNVNSSNSSSNSSDSSSSSINSSSTNNTINSNTESTDISGNTSLNTGIIVDMDSSNTSENIDISINTNNDSIKDTTYVDTLGGEYDEKSKPNAMSYIILGGLGVILVLLFSLIRKVFKK